MQYKLSMVDLATKDTDYTQSISISVDLPSPPILLGDFSGGTGRYSDGYATVENKFSIKSSESDPRRLELVFLDGFEATLHPYFERIPAGSLNTPQPCPLRLGQEIGYSNIRGERKTFAITWSTWGLR